MPVTIILLLLNTVAYVWEMQSGGTSVCEIYGFDPDRVSSVTIVTSLFLHDPQTVNHLLMNLIFLALCGPVVEAEVGSLRFSALYLGSGVLGALLHATVSSERLVGASGAIFGVLAVFTYLRPRAFWIVAPLALVNVWWATRGGSEHLSFGTHLGGLAFGVIFAGILWATEREVEA